ncbi:MAG: DMT family transporter [Burkholderiales bacterium]|jgi:drug/metabolite transporter (DMT)-like permease|nr:DMT family transporter [Burkholderiales bacterium]
MTGKTANSRLMDHSNIAALVTAFFWACSGLLAVYPVQQLGSFTFNRIRLQAIFAILCVLTLITGGWRTLGSEHFAALALSGFIGILIGDSLLYASLLRLGPRRNSILFSVHAPITALLSFLVLDERLSPVAVGGITLVVVGVMLAIAFGRRAEQKHQWESVSGPLTVGVSIALIAALCQSVSALIAKPVMVAGVDPIAASVVRVSMAAMFFTLLGFLPQLRSPVRITPRLFLQSTASGICGMVIGMTTLLFALAHGKTGLVATLSSTSPIMILPLLWLRTKERPALGAWIGAAIAVAGITLIFNH